jgi:hypothetical protein
MHRHATVLRLPPAPLSKPFAQPAQGKVNARKIMTSLTTLLRCFFAYSVARYKSSRAPPRALMAHHLANRVRDHPSESTEMSEYGVLIRQVLERCSIVVSTQDESLITRYLDQPTRVLEWQVLKSADPARSIAQQIKHVRERALIVGHNDRLPARERFCEYGIAT